MIPATNKICETRNSSSLPLLNVRHKFFRITFSPYFPISEWNKLYSYICISKSFQISEKFILMLRQKANSIYSMHNPLAIIHLKRLGNGYSHPKEHYHRHNFQDSVNPMCNCGNGVETTVH